MTYNSVLVSGTQQRESVTHNPLILDSFPVRSLPSVEWSSLRCSGLLIVFCLSFYLKGVFDWYLWSVCPQSRGERIIKRCHMSQVETSPRRHVNYLWGCEDASASREQGDAETDEQAPPCTFTRGNTVTSRNLLSWGLWTQPRL